MRTLFILFVTLLLAGPAWAQSLRVRGRVLDSTGASIPAASVTGYDGDQIMAQTATDDAGEFTVSLPQGEYRLEVAAPDFETYTDTIAVRSGMAPLSITLNVAPVRESLEVPEDPYTINLEPDRNLTAIVLDEEDLRDLPDDEEELAEILREMAGPGADAAGGTEFIVDGFSGGRLPPKDQIQEIRINSNPFSSEYSRPGRGRIHVITRAGTGRLRGNVGFSFRDEALNARNAFADRKPPYQRRNLRANLSGPLLRDRLSFALFAMRSDQDESDTVQAITPDGPFSQAIVRPNKRRRYVGRTQYKLLEDHTLNFNVHYSTGERKNQGVGGFTLPERASQSESSEWEFQLRETAVLSPTAVHETRFEFERETASTRPLTDGAAINVLDAFRGGGAANRNERTDRHFQFGNLLTFSARNLTVKTGAQVDYRQLRTLSEDNFRGTFIFSSLEALESGRPTTFAINSGNPRLDLNQMEFAIFLQNDLKVSNDLTLSFGLRYETQMNIGDRNNFDPRFGFAYRLNQSTVLRGGAGLFHQRLRANTVESLLRLDGTRQLQTVIRNPSYPEPFASGSGTEAVLPASQRDRSGDLALPYTVNSSLSIEKRLPRGLILTATYDFVRGIHLYRSRNINAPLPGQSERPDPARGNIELLESTAKSTYHGLTIGYRLRLARASLFGSYTVSANYSDSGGAFSLPANNYDLRAEWGPSAQDRRHSFYTGIQLPLPRNFSINTRVRTNSGRPFNITTGFDDNNDTVTNDRPTGVRRNSGQGPGFFNMDLTLTKTIPLKSNNPTRLGGRTGGEFPPPGRAGRPGRRGGGDRYGGGRGDFRRRSGGPEMRIFANLRNVLNHTNFSRFSGVLTSPFFGQPNSARDPREVEIGVRFSF